MTDAQSRLLEVLAARGSALGRQDIGWAFEHVRTAGPVAAYVDAFLGGDDATLLSAEELALETHLQKTGVWAKLLQQSAARTAAKTGAALGAALRAETAPSAEAAATAEAALAAETDELAERTQRLHAHTAQLRQQAAALGDMRARGRAERERRRRQTGARARKWQAEAAELQAALAELAGVLGEEVADLRATAVAPGALAAPVTAMLAGDDRVLARLQRLAAGVADAAAEGGDDAAVARVEALATQLAALETRAVRRRLDATFLSYPPPAATAPLDLPDPPALQAEVDALYAEIPAVARGAAYNEFLEPLLARRAAARATRSDAWAVGGAYVCRVLAYLRDRTRAQSALLSERLDRDAAVRTLCRTYAREAAPAATAPARPATPPPPQPPPPHTTPNATPHSMPHQPPHQPRPGDPPRRRGAGSPVKLGRVALFTPAHRRRPSSVDLRGAWPELALLAHLGLALPPPGSPSRPGPGPGPPPPPVIGETFLAGQVAALAAKLDHALAQPTAAWHAAAAEAAAVVRTLHAALWAGNPFREPGELPVVRRDVIAAVADLDRGVQALGPVIARLVARVDALQRLGGDDAVDGRKRAFVARWGR